MCMIMILFAVRYSLNDCISEQLQMLFSISHVTGQFGAQAIEAMINIIVRKQKTSVILVMQT